MSVRLEYVPATSPVYYANELAAAQELPVDNPEDRDVLLISYDEVIVLVGSPEELQDFALRVISAVARGAAPRPTGMEIRAADIEAGDRVFEDVHGGRLIEVAEVDQHGDTVLVTGTKSEKRTFDRDEVVVKVTT